MSKNRIVKVIVTYKITAGSHTDMQEALRDLEEEVRTMSLGEIYGVYAVKKIKCRIEDTGRKLLPKKPKKGKK